jgi:PTS system nitrogen regulatory IIA component
VLHEIVKVLPLPGDVDREFLATVLEAREAMGSTGIGGGIAIPHVRNPILLPVEDPFVSLFLLRHPIDFDAVDGQPVHALFVVVSSNIPMHLRILAQLGLCCVMRNCASFCARDHPSARSWTACGFSSQAARRGRQRGDGTRLGARVLAGGCSGRVCLRRRKSRSHSPVLA